MAGQRGPGPQVEGTGREVALWVRMNQSLLNPTRLEVTSHTAQRGALMTTSRPAPSGRQSPADSHSQNAGHGRNSLYCIESKHLQKNNASVNTLAFTLASIFVSHFYYLLSVFSLIPLSGD